MSWQLTEQIQISYEYFYIILLHDIRTKHIKLGHDKWFREWAQGIDNVWYLRKKCEMHLYMQEVDEEGIIYCLLLVCWQKLHLYEIMPGI